jgi:hypothetical protein
MFWRVSTYAQPTPVEAFLDKGNTDLEELLQLDELLQVLATTPSWAFPLQCSALACRPAVTSAPGMG